MDAAGPARRADRARRPTPRSPSCSTRSATAAARPTGGCSTCCASSRRSRPARACSRRRWPSSRAPRASCWATSACSWTPASTRRRCTHSGPRSRRRSSAKGSWREAMRGGGDGLPLLRGVIAQTIAAVAGEEQVIVFAERVWCLRQLARTLRERHGVEAHVGDGVASPRPSSRRSSSASPRGEFPVLCLSRVGQEGHNLQNASCLTHLDLPWTPAGLEQRVGRAARPGSARGWVQTYIPYISGAGVEHIVSSSPPAAPSTTPSWTASTASAADIHRRHPARRDHRPGRRPPSTTPATRPPPPACASPPASSAPDSPLARATRAPLNAILKGGRAMSAIDAALNTIDRVAQRATWSPTGRASRSSSTAWPTRSCCPTAGAIYPPRLHGRPVDELACALLDMDDPAQSTFLRLTGPPGVRQEPARAGRSPTGCGPAAAARCTSATAARSTGSSRSPADPRRRVPVPARVRARRRRRRHHPARRLGVRAGDARGLDRDGRRGQHDPRRRPAQSSTPSSTAASRSTCPPPARR